MQLLSWSCPGLPGSVHVPLWSRPLLARVGGQSCTGACPRPKQVEAKEGLWVDVRPGGRAAEQGLRGRWLRERSSGIASQAGVRDRVRGPGGGDPGLPEARKAHTHLRHRDAPPAGRYPQPAQPAACAARCPATVRARRLPACFAWRQHATARRGPQLRRPCPALSGSLWGVTCRVDTCRVEAIQLVGPSLLSGLAFLPPLPCK